MKCSTISQVPKLLDGWVVVEKPRGPYDCHGDSTLSKVTLNDLSWLLLQKMSPFKKCLYDLGNVTFEA
jgi:hypothetical protein